MQGTIIMVSASLHEKAKLEMDNLNSEKYFDQYKTFANTQLANQLFISELSRRCLVHCLPVTANCAELVQSRTGLSDWMDRVTGRGAAHPVITLASVTGVTGHILSGGRMTRCEEMQGADQAARLWELSAHLISVRLEELIV